MTTGNPHAAGDGAPPPSDIADSIETAGVRFEAEWRAGRSPRIESYLAEVPSAAAPVLLRELLRRERDLMPGDDLRPSADDYRARFPDLTGVIDEVFAVYPPPGVAETVAAQERAGVVPTPEVPGYLILGELGRRGMGIVYKARQLNLNRVCALKMFSTNGAVTGEVARRFLAEATTIASVQHPNVVQIYQSGQHDGLLYFEMEFVEGGSLAQRLNGAAWPSSRAARLIDSVARAVDEVHHHRIVHRDLKPANILLAADGTPKVADFGLAKSLDPDANFTVAGVILGTPNYVSPEQAQGLSRTVGVATDVHALGAILYELLTGRPPFQGGTKLEVLEKIKTIEPQPPSRLVRGIPEDIEAVCLKCLRKSPAERYDSAGDLAEDLRRFINGEPTLARASNGLKKTTRRSAMLYPALALAALGSLLSLCILGVFLYHRDGRKAEEPKAAAKEAPNPQGVPYLVQQGDFPFSIAARMLGDGNRWKEMRMKDGRPLTEKDIRELLPGDTLYLPPFSAP